MACTYNGHPRSDYSYSGTNTSLFQQWQNCQISTQRFARRTAQGNGTASLTLKATASTGGGSSPTPGTSPSTSPPSTTSASGGLAGLFGINPVVLLAIGGSALAVVLAAIGVL